MSSQVITRKSYQRLQAELREMREVQQPQIRERISAARDLGDLAENSEYHSAREELSMLMFKIAQLEDRLNNCRIVDESQIDTGSVKVFTKVTLRDHNRDCDVVFQLVEPEETSLKEGKISVDSPIARGLMGKKVGESAEIEVPVGTMHYTVLKIERCSDGSG